MRFTLYYYHFLLQALIMSLSPSHVLCIFNLRTHLLILILILYHTPSATKRKIKELLILIYMLITKKFMNAPHVHYTSSIFFIQAALDEATEPWGIKVERVEM